MDARLARLTAAYANEANWAGIDIRSESLAGLRRNFAPEENRRRETGRDQRRRPAQRMNASL
jgi:hypothetical protein